MNRKFDLIVFDWDGTLMDSTAAIVNAIIEACRDVGAPEPVPTRARHVIGMGLPEALRYVAPGLPEETYPRLVERYRFHYLSNDQTLTLFPGVPGMLQTLATNGHKLAVATGKSRVGLDRALTHSGLAPLFDCTRCADESFSKPHPAMLEEIMGTLNISRERTLMVGDTTHDLQMALNAGVAGLAVAFGAHPRSELETSSPIAILDDPAAYSIWFREHA